MGCGCEAEGVVFETEVVADCSSHDYSLGSNSTSVVNNNSDASNDCKAAGGEGVLFDDRDGNTDIGTAAGKDDGGNNSTGDDSSSSAHDNSSNIRPNASNPQIRKYVGSVGTPFKRRLYNHRSSFRILERRNMISLASHIWNLKDERIPYAFKWKILQQLAWQKRLES